MQSAQDSLTPVLFLQKVKELISDNSPENILEGLSQDNCVVKTAMIGILNLLLLTLLVRCSKKGKKNQEKPKQLFSSSEGHATLSFT